jgi:hypothetical protein
MSLTAFALREEMKGETEVELADGTTETRPTYGGGVLAIGGTSIDVGELLEENDGVLVVENGQASLVELLKAYGPLKEIAPPKGAKILSLYSTWPRAALLDEARRRELVGYTRLNSATLVAVLQRQDAERGAGVVADDGGDQPEDLRPGVDALDIAEDVAAERERRAKENDNGTGNAAGSEGTS